ncbi:hypothetical protein G7Y89_g11629 [Cudoniella acicularis]|uniref:Heterokaryon incompatibility domain-containing protein n=1 Tax=Cudoniella acicularis TaxID=354080 RepID=A0A8H4RCW1_9HELO|nr:hypothetical protein G7Y89_g11629 [Cudoniella acicularis]
MASKENHFTYSPLEEDRQFRLLRLEPGQDTDPLSCELFDHSLDEAPNYDALSYTWGSNHPLYEIRCGGHNFQVTKNLHEALCRFRCRDKVRVMWIDAICIDQSNDKEKTKQVQMMGEIYSRSHQLMIWLGHPPEDTTARLAIRAFGKLKILFESHAKGLQLRVLPMFQKESPEYREALEAIHRGLEKTPILDEEWKSLGIFFFTPWFTRAWIVQEATLAPNNPDAPIKLCFGRYEITWDDLLQIAGGVLTFGLRDEITDRSEKKRPPIALLRTIDTFREEIRHPSTVFSCLNLTRELHCGDPRDQIYALLGIIQRDKNEQALVDDLPPQYDRPVALVYIDLAVHWLFRRNSFLLFELICDKPCNETCIDDLPSWVNDWTQKTKQVAFRSEWFSAGLSSRVGDFPLNGYKFAKEIAPRLNISLSTDRRRLTVKGKILGTIKWNVPPREHFTYEYIMKMWSDGKFGQFPGFDISNYKMDSLRWMQWYQDCVYRAHLLDPNLTALPTSTMIAPPPSRTSQYKSTQQSLYEAFWRTLVCDLDGRGGKAPSRLEKGFVKWHEVFPRGCGLAASLHDPELEEFDRLQQEFTPSRRFITTDTGFMGWAPERAIVTDLVCVILGARDGFCSFDNVVSVLQKKHIAEIDLSYDCFANYTAQAGVNYNGRAPKP